MTHIQTTGRAGPGPNQMLVELDLPQWAALELAANPWRGLPGPRPLWEPKPNVGTAHLACHVILALPTHNLAQAGNGRHTAKRKVDTSHDT